jgi:hypothetical protein
MNMQFSAPYHVNRFVFSLVSFVVMLSALFMAFQLTHITPQIILVSAAHPAEARPSITATQLIPQVIPVPEPAQSSPAHGPQVQVTPVPAGAQFQPVPQPVATPPARK